MNQKRFLCAAILAGVLSAGAAGAADFACGELTNPYGPFDYTNPEHRREKLPIVEQYHFSTEVETLRAGVSGGVGGDIDYTLRAFPNHHRALSALIRYAVKSKSQHPAGLKYPVECYFVRAESFQPKDARVQLAYGIYLMQFGRLDEAEGRMLEANRIEAGSANILYNLGLLYADKKDYAKSREYARRAYSMGFPLPGLKNKLVRAGQWRD